MYILNSDRDCILNTANIARIARTGQYIIADTPDGRNTLGTYATDERTKEVFNELVIAMSSPIILKTDYAHECIPDIRKQFIQSAPLCINDGAINVIDCGVFHMPEE